MTNIDSDLLTDENLEDYKIEDDVKLYNDLAVGQWSLNGNFAWRVNAINTLAPWLVRTGRAGAVNELAQMNISDDEIVTRSSELSAAWKGTELMKMMENLNASEQRAWWAQMSFSQQRTLEAAGYKLPRNGINTASGAAQFFGQITKPAQWALSDVGKPVGSALIKALSFGYDQTVARQWRTIAQLGPEAKIGAAVGGAGGFAVGAGLAAGISAATGGIGTLPTLAILGLSALGGATVGSFTASALTGNAENWIQAWARAGDGEKLFTPEAISEVNRKLGGSPELQALVVRVSAEIGTDIDLAELVQEVSGQREITISKQIGKLQKVASEYAPQGTAEYSMIMRGLTEIVGDPIVQEAILTLQQGKYSMGRSFARTLNLDPNSSAYRYVSGGIDAAAMILLDPLNVATAGVKAFQTIKRGIDVADGTVAAAKFRALAEEPAFARVFDLVAEGVRTGNTMKVRRYAKQWFPIYDDLLTYAKTGADVSVQNFSGKDVVEFIVGHSHLKSVTSGIGIVPGINRLVLKPLTRRGYAFKTVTGETLDFFRGISDLSLEKVITKIADNPDALRQIFKDIPSDNIDEILASNILPDEWANILIKESGLGQGYSLGRTAGKLPGISHVLRPVAGVIDALNTAVPRGKAIWLVSNSERNNDIVNFVDLFRTLGMPSYARELWKKQIFDAPDFRGRVNAISALMDSIATAAGMRNTQEGVDLLDNFLTKFKQEFAVGRAGKTVGHAPHVYVSAGVRPVADMAQMFAIPDLKELRQAVAHGTVLRALIGLPEDFTIAANAMRFWKPAVLFRLGFAFRNSGEDLLAMIARYGMGSFIQEFGARSIGKRDAFKEATRIRNEMNRLYRLGQGGVKLTTQQRYILNHYEFPVGFNKIANAVRKLGPTGSPILHVIEEWGKYVQQFFEGGLSGLTNIKTIANVEKRMAEWQNIENIGIAKRLAPRKVTENLKFVADHMAWGNKYSARRMLAGGVNPMLAQAGREWASTHVFTIMQRLGTAPGFGLDYQGRELSAMQRMFQNEEPNFAIVQGERTLRFKDQPDGDLIEDYHTALYNQFTGLTEDPIMRQALVEVLNIYDEGMRAILPPDQLTMIFRQWHELTQVFGVGVAPKLENTIVHMFLRLNENTDQVTRAERFQDMLRKLSDTKVNEQSLIPGKLANILSNKYRGLSTPSPEDFLDELFSMTSPRAPIDNKLQQLNNLQTMLNSVNPLAKEWLLAHFMRDWATDGSHIADLVARPTNRGVLYRGFGGQSNVDDASYELLPDGSLRINLSSSDDISFTPSYDVAYQGTVVDDFEQINYDEEIGLSTGRMTERPSDTGVILTVDLNALLKQFGLTREDLVRLEDIDDPMDLLKSGILGRKPAAWSKSSGYPGPFDANRTALFRKQRGQDDIPANIVLPPGTFTLHSPARGIFVELADTTFAMGGQSAQGSLGITDWTNVFHRTFDDARDAMSQKMAFEFESGDWDSFLNRNRRVIETNTSPVFVVDLQNLPPWSFQYESFSYDGPRSLSILDDFINHPGPGQLRFETGLDSRDELFKLIKSAVDEQVPLVVTNEAAANEIRDALNRVFTQLNPYSDSKTLVNVSNTSPVSPVDYIVPPVRKVFLPMGDETTDLNGLIKAGESKVVSAQKVLSNPGLKNSGPFDIIGWPTDTYPWIPEYLLDAPVKASQTEIIDSAIDAIAQTVRPGFNQQWVNKQDLWTEFEGQPLLIPAGTKLDTTNLWSTPELAEGSFVQIDDFRYTEALIPQYSGQNEVQWRAVAPLMYDDAERLAGRTANVPRSAPILVDDSRLTSKVQAPLFDETVEVPRFTDKDILNIPMSERPNAVVAKRRTLNAEPTGWDKLVYIGFNKILGPMMDAMSRKPMAFHAFAVNFERNIKMASWRLTGTVQENAVNDLISRLISRGLYEQADSDTSKIITEAARIIGRDHAIDVADFWTDGQAFAYLRGYIREVGETKFLDELTTMIADGKTTFSQQQRASLDYLRRNTPRIQSMSLDFGGPQDFLDNLIGYLGDDFVRAPGVAARLGNIGSPMLEDLVKNMTDKDWKILSDYRAMRNKLVEESSAVAAEAAIRDTLPYVDSHEIRSQFADWGRGYMPFWYAEENFIKRWAKILAMDSGLNGLNFLRKTHMTYTGLRHVGFIRRDSNGTDYFIYPGSELFTETLARVSGVNPKTLSHFLESRTDRMLPGIGSDFGRPSFGPFAILPVKFFTWMVPQIDPTDTMDRPMKEFERNFLGDVGVNRTIWQTLIPKTVLTTLDATGFWKTSSFDMSYNERLMSSTNSAIAYMEASGVKSDSNPDGMALPDAATVEERDDYLRDAREFAKAGFLAQMLAGWVVPGPVTQNVGVESDNIIDFLTGGVNKTPDELLAKDYITLVRDLGIEDGTIAFMNLYRRENGAFNSQVLFNPLAFTVGATESVSGAPLPSTEDAVKYYLNNQEAYDQWPYAGPWLLPQDQEGDARSKWAYDQTVIAGLRTYRGTSQEFLNELKFKEAALPYFEETRKYDKAIEAAGLAGNKTAKKQIEAFKKVFVDNFKAAHPYFAQELQSEKARTRRLQIVSEMSILINDPDFPGRNVPHFEGIKEITLAYQDYKNFSGYVRPDGSELTDREKAVLLQQLDVLGQAMVKKYPGAVAYWTTVIKPLAGIDS